MQMAHEDEGSGKVPCRPPIQKVSGRLGFHSVGGDVTSVTRNCDEPHGEKRNRGERAFRRRSCGAFRWDEGTSGRIVEFCCHLLGRYAPSFRRLPIDAALDLLFSAMTLGTHTSTQSAVVQYLTAGIIRTDINAKETSSKATARLNCADISVRLQYLHPGHQDQTCLGIFQSQR